MWHGTLGMRGGCLQIVTKVIAREQRDRGNPEKSDRTGLLRHYVPRNDGYAANALLGSQWLILINIKRNGVVDGSVV